MKLIDGESISNMCDYSFGDQSGVICGIYNGYMKTANISNTEFINKYNEIKSIRKYMTLFIDNIRLYKRYIKVDNENDQKWINNLMINNDLLYLCSQLKDMNFIIFTNLEDTPIDSQIEGKIPENVLGIHSANCIYRNEKVHPFPYGVQRKMNPYDNRKDILFDIIMSTDNTPNKILYVNHSINTNLKERVGINEIFKDEYWATVDVDRKSYSIFYSEIKNHKFVICPIGNAIDCHRNWEVLYLRRVPIMKKNKYLEFLFQSYPVLFVNDYCDITLELLNNNEYLYNSAINMNFDNMDLDFLFQKIINNYGNN